MPLTVLVAGRQTGVRRRSRSPTYDTAQGVLGAGGGGDRMRWHRDKAVRMG